MSEPTTRAGCDLALSEASTGNDITADILAIEQEAAKAERERLGVKGERMYANLPEPIQSHHSLFLMVLLSDDEPDE